MKDQVLFDKIDLPLIRVLHTVLTEHSVSRSALRPDGVEAGVPGWVATVSA